MVSLKVNLKRSSAKKSRLYRVRYTNETCLPMLTAALPQLPSIHVIRSGSNKSWSLKQCLNPSSHLSWLGRGLSIGLHFMNLDLNMEILTVDIISDSSLKMGGSFTSFFIHMVSFWHRAYLEGRTVLETALQGSWPKKAFKVLLHATSTCNPTGGS